MNQPAHAITAEEERKRLQIHSYAYRWLEEQLNLRPILALPEPDPSLCGRQHDYYLVRWWRDAAHLNATPQEPNVLRVCASDMTSLFIDLTFDKDGYPICPRCQAVLEHLAYTEPPFYTPYRVAITKDGIKLVKGEREYTDDDGCRFECPDCQLNLTEQVEMMGWTDGIDDVQEDD